MQKLNIAILSYRSAKFGGGQGVYIKDISFEIPTPDSFVDAAQNLGSYSTKLDINKFKYANSGIEYHTIRKSCCLF